MNQYLFDLVYRFAHKNFLLDDLGIFLAQYLPYLLVLGFLILIYYYDRGWKMRFLVFAEGALGIILARGILTEIIRFFYYNARPFEAHNFVSLIGESGSSFPSGHATFFFALAMTVFFYNRKMGVWYFVAATVMGLARIFVGVHWPLDILGGAIIGAASGWYIHGLVRPTLARLSGGRHGAQPQTIK